MQVVILAGGLGTRLRPMTEQMPKPMVPVRGRPFLLNIVEHLVAQGFRDQLMLLGYKGEQVQEFFGDGSRFDAHISYAREQFPLGTAGAIRNAFDQLESEFLLLYGDSFLPIDYRAVESAFRAVPCEGLVVGYDNTVADTGVRNNLAVDANGYVLCYDKTKAAPDLKYVEAGVLCLKRELFAPLITGQVVSLENELYPQLIARRTLRALVTRQRFFDIGTPGRLEEFAERA